MTKPCPVPGCPYRDNVQCAYTGCPGARRVPKPATQGNKQMSQATDAVKAHHKRQQHMGLTLLRVYVPEDQAEKFTATAMIERGRHLLWIAKEAPAGDEALHALAETSPRLAKPPKAGAIENALATAHELADAAAEYDVYRIAADKAAQIVDQYDPETEPSEYIRAVAMLNANLVLASGWLTLLRNNAAFYGIVI